MKCFADLSEKHCGILKPKKCTKCSFFKTEEQVEKGRDLAIKRIDSLDKIARQNIYEKYFTGGN